MEHEESPPVFLKKYLEKDLGYKDASMDGVLGVLRNTHEKEGEIIHNISFFFLLLCTEVPSFHCYENTIFPMWVPLHALTSTDLRPPGTGAYIISCLEKMAHTPTL